MSFIVILTLALTIHVSQAQTSREQYLSAHNAARAEVNVGPLVWDDTVAAYATNYANQRAGDCNLIHSKGSPYADAVKLWVNEKRFYDYQSNSCQGGETCGHYTQVVWRNSVRLGCASVTCNNGGTFVICSYDPRGNWIGQLMNFIVVLTLALTIHVSQAQTSPEQYLSAHNAARADVNVGPLVWDDSVAAYANIYANQRAGDCNLVHSGGPYGENLAMSTGDLSAADAIKLWVDEKSCYDYQSNSCLGGECGHYTQVVCSGGRSYYYIRRIIPRK
ncbi:hypothetical protein MKW92_028276 [Papaver armeniacum]|nr:hypothetical protein MKW92_028276 [Papaver armeniacum]